MKNYAVILAGGMGKRMGEKLPKQFIKLQDIPIIILTIKNVINVRMFDDIYVAIHSEWKEYLEELLNKYNIYEKKLHIIFGGKERLDSIYNSIQSIEKDNVIQEQDIVVVCDAVRPFTTKQIFMDSIDKARKFGACVCTLPAIDTMLFVENNIVTQVPSRQNIFHGQAPDSFKISILYKALNSLTEEEKKIITGTAQICVLKHIPVYTIPGDIRNIKITTPEDIKIAENIIKMGEN